MDQAQIDNALVEIAANCYDDPEKFILLSWQFGVPGSPLEHSTGLEKWQKTICDRIKAHVRSGTDKPFKHATASGHGVGKSAFVSMIQIWFIATRPGAAGRVTANTDRQLKTTTWRELSKWWEMCLHKSWFEKTATQFFAVSNPDTWRIDAVSWSKDNTIAFQGVHGRDVIIVFDEASGIIDPLWAVVEGALTESGAFFLVFGNPNRNSGQFRRCFRADSDWQTLHVDSRDVSWNRRDYGESILRDFGEDQYKIRVLGQFPDTDMSQFLPGHAIQLAYDRGLFEWGDAGNINIPMAIGVDVARFGDDETVILCRRGNHIPVIDRRRGLDIYQTATLVEQYIKTLKPRAVNIDVVGYGAGVVDFLKHNGHRGLVFGCNGGSKPAHPDRHYNLRAELWANARDWVTNSGVLSEENEDHVEMVEQAAAVLFGYNDKGQLRLERKEELKKREGWSPDLFDALSLTFARRLTNYTGAQNSQPGVEF